jgi:WD40 repeat protein/beta-lactamase regulating signal transducer with metallopeptidase domain
MYALEAGLSNSLLAVVLAVVVYAVTRVWRSPYLRHCLWLLVLAKLVTPPLINLAWPKGFLLAQVNQEVVRTTSDASGVSMMAADTHGYAIPIETSQDASDVSLGSSNVEVKPHVVVRTDPANRLPAASTEGSEGWHAMDWDSAKAAVALVWLAGTVAWLVIVSSRIARFHRSLTETLPASERLQDRIKDLATTMRLRRCPAIRLVQACVSPMVWLAGPRPVLVLPMKLVRQLTEAELDTLIAHEMAHIRRGDHFVRWFELFVTAIYWWNPVVWLARRALREAEEECCDATVRLVLPEHGRSYVSALLETLRFVSREGTIVPVLGSGFDSGKELKRRIEMFLTCPSPTPLCTQAKVALLLAAALTLPVSAQSTHDIKENERAARSENTSDSSTDSGLPVGAGAGTPIAEGVDGLLPDGALARIGSLRLRHGKMVRHVVFTADGDRLVSWGEDDALCVWDSNTGALLSRHTFSGQVPWGSVVLPSGRTAEFGLLVGGDGSCHLWDLTQANGEVPTVELAPPFQGHDVGGFAGQDNESFATFALSPDGSVLAGASSGSTDRDRLVRFWQLESGEKPENMKLLAESERNLGRVRWMDFALYGQRLVVLTEEGPPYNPIRERNQPQQRTYAAVVLNSTTGEEIRRISLPELWVFHMEQPLAVSPDGRLLAVGTTERTVELYHLSTGEKLRRLEGHDGVVNGVVFSPDGILVASSDRGEDGTSVRLWDVASGKFHRPLAAYDTAVETMAFSPDGRVLATGAQDHRILLWDVASGRPLPATADRTWKIFGVTLSDDARLVATATGFQSVELWDVPTGRKLWTVQMPGAAAVAISPDGTTVAAGGRGVRLLNAATGKELGQVGGNEHFVGFNSLAFSPDGGRLITASGHDKTVCVWDTTTRQQVMQFVLAEDPSCVAISPDGRALAVAEHGINAASTTVHLWNLESGELRKSMRPDKCNVESLAFSPDGRTLAAGGHSTAHGYRIGDDANLASPGFRDSLELWDVKTGKRMRQFPIPEVPEWVSLRIVNSVHFSRDGQRLITAERDGVIRVYDVATAELTGSLTGHLGEVRSLAVSADGRLLASGSVDTTTLLWDVASIRR